MSDERPDPDELLKRVAESEAGAQRGKLKIFFGAAPGVGKTYAMLEAAREQAREGADVVVGYVEPHARPETQALVLGLDVLPRRTVEYRNAKMQEFDLEAALARHPQLLIVDELAHTNLPTGQIVAHAKRWQDVEVLLKAGINVYSTLNVQHLESLNDVVGRITGVRVRETVPDTVFDNADEIELVDLPPDELIERLHEGKVYLPSQARLAVANFFNKGNLIALRELALRRTAERVSEQMQDFRIEHAVARSWPTSERLLVCVGPSPTSAELIRSTARMAGSLHAPWMAVHIEAPADARLAAADRERLAQHLKLADQLGGETATLSGTDPVGEVIRFAQKRNVTKIVVGKPNQPRWREWFRAPFVYELTRRSGDIAIYVISGEEERPAARQREPQPARSRTSAYLSAAAIVALCTLLAWLTSPIFPLLNIVMLYQLGIVAVALWFGGGPATLAVVLSVAAFDFFFIPPYWTFAVTDLEYVVTFFVMLTTGLIISGLAARVNFQAESAQHRERRTAALYALGKQLAALRTIEEIAQTAVQHIASASDADVRVLLPDASRRISEPQLTEQERGTAQWVLEHAERAGLGCDTLAGVDAMYLPLRAASGTLGVLQVRPKDPGQVWFPEQIDLLESLAGLVALALEREQWARAAEQARTEIEAERLRNSLLSAVSHDLRTPLTAIVGASSTLTEIGDQLDPPTRQALARSITDEAEHLNRQVSNLLDMVRLDSGAIQPHLEWQPLEEIVGAVLNRLSQRLAEHPVTTQLAPDLPLVPIDSLLIQQVLFNILDNASKYSPSGTPITIAAESKDGAVEVSISDRGPGLPAGAEKRIFDRFYRAPRNGQPVGSGLGLTISRGLVELHGGRIWAENRREGGLTIHFILPIAGEPPVIQSETNGALEAPHEHHV